MNGHSLPGAKKGLLVKFAEDHHRRLQRQEQGQVMRVRKQLCMLYDVKSSLYRGMCSFDCAGLKQRK